VVYNGVDLERFHPRNVERDRAGARHEASVPAHGWVTLFVGSGFERKGLDTAIAALARGQDHASRLIVIGKGECAPYAALASRLKVSERIVWLGPRADVERWYAAADAVVLPTRYEPFGNVHLEALASGVPVVTSRAAGGAEIVAGAQAGSVVDPHDATAIACALDELRARPRAEVAAFARAAAEPFTYARQVAGFEAIYRRLPARKA
jgi:UDP-glucose:(heptosyl)LPS alpha-1,3-glucosyltransferase